MYTFSLLRHMVMSMTTATEVSKPLNPTAVSWRLNFAMDSGGFTQVSIQTAENMVKKRGPYTQVLVAYETDLTLPQGLKQD
jgi:hypothetical protein